VRGAVSNDRPYRDQTLLVSGNRESSRLTARSKAAGLGQGSVISPLLANVYLHYVFDLWAERWRRHEATGGMTTATIMGARRASGQTQ